MAQKLCGNCGVNIMIMPVCNVQLPEGLAVLHGLLKVSVGLKEVRCTQHAAISLRQERNLSTVCLHSTLVTQASSEIGAHALTQSQEKHTDENLTVTHNESEEQLRTVNSHIV